MAVSFPKDAEILWDRTPLSNPIVLKYSDVFTFFILTGKDVFNFIKFLSEGHGGIELQGKVLHVSEMTPLQRNALNNSIFAKSCKFSLVLNSDYNDRNSNASMITIPIKAVLPTDSLTNSNQFEYENFRAQLEKSIRISKTFALKNYFRVRGTGKGTSISALNELSGSIKFEALAPDINIRCTPLRPIPILATPLSVMLMSTSLSSSAVPNFGYLSLNQTRKVVFLNDNDPGITVTPTVGVWVRYDDNYKNSELVDDAIFHPFSWLACLRFIQNESLLKDYILDGNTFLLAILINEFISYFEITPVSTENTGTFTPMARLQDYKLNLVDLDFTVDLRADANANFDDDANANNIAPHRDRSVVCKFKRVVSPANKSMKASPASPYVANTASLMSSMTPVEGSELFPRGFSIQPIASPSHPSSSAKMISSIEKLRSSNEIIESTSPNLKPTGGKPAASVFYKLETASNTSLNPSISRSQEFQSTKSQGIPAPIEIVRSSSNNLLSPSSPIKQKSSDDPSISSIITPQNEDSAYSMKRFTISNNPTTPRISKTPSTDALRNSKNGGTDLFQLVIQQHNEINELRNYINTLRRIILDLDGDYPDFQLCEDIHVGPSENQFEKNDQVIHQEDSLVLQSQPKSDEKQENSMNNNNNNNSNSNPAHLITNFTENQLEDMILPKYVNAEDRLEIRNFLDVDERDEKMEAYRNSIEGISKNLLHLNNQSGGDSISSISSNNKKNNQKGAKTVLFQDHVHKSIQKPVTKPFHLLQNAKILMEMPSTIQESESIIAIQQKYL